MKERLDVLLVQRGFFPSREKAKTTIMEGLVYVNGQKEDKAGMKFPSDAVIEVRGHALRYVSRGGLKLEKAVNEFGIDLEGRVCMDIGASTGGFTDCMLQNGAAKVYSIDVGYGQLDWSLRNDSRVVCMEHFNARNLSPEDVPDTPSFSSIDVSFISLRLILGPVMNALSDDGSIAALIKPQFEAGRDKVGRKGVVRDPLVHEEVIASVLESAAGLGLRVKGLTFSPVTGPEGNIEYLAFFGKDGTGEADGGYPDLPDSALIENVVRDAHDTLDGHRRNGTG